MKKNRLSYLWQMILPVFMHSFVQRKYVAKAAHRFYKLSLKMLYKICDKKALTRIRIRVMI